MTKLKSKKMTKSTFAVIIMAILMVAMLAFGGTYAYFTATTKEDKANITLGYLKLKDNDAMANIVLENVFPGQQILPAGSYDDTNTADVDEKAGIILTINTNDRKGNYVAVRFDFQIILNDDADYDPNDPSTDQRTRLTSAIIYGDPTIPEDKGYVGDVGLVLGEDMVPDGVYNKTANPSATKPDYEGTGKTEAEIFEIDNGERVAMKEGYEYDDNANPNDWDYSATLHKKCQYIQLFEDLKADNIKNIENEDNVIGGYNNTTTDVAAVDAYYWDNFYEDDQNIYFITSTADANKDSLQAIGATNLGSRTNDNKDKWDNYSAEVELIVNAEEFKLDIEINDNWSEEEFVPDGSDADTDPDLAPDGSSNGEGTTSNYKKLPDLGIQGAVIEIVVTAASVQATGGETGEVINKDHAVAQLVALLPGYDFEHNTMFKPTTPDFTPANP